MTFRYGKPEEVGMSAERVKFLEDTVSGWVTNGTTPAIVMLAARKGVIVSHKAFGVSGPEAGAPPLKLDTLFPISSITKPVTAACIMILLEKGLLDLNRPVQSYIPEFTGEGKEAVMVHHLLTHTTGLNEKDIRNNIEKKENNNAPVPPPEKTTHPLLSKRLYYGYDTPLRTAPGTVMSYCNFGFEMAGEIVQRLSGQSMEAFARENIFDPLGMKDTHYIVPDDKFTRVIRRKPYSGNDTDWYTSPESLRYPSCAGGIYSTAIDLAIFGQMILNKGTYGGKRILSPVTVSEMIRNQIPGVNATYEDEVFKEACWGYGWNVRGHKKDTCGTLRSPTSVNHGGFSGVSFWVDPVYETVCVYFSVDAKFNMDLFINIAHASIEELD